MAITPSVFGAQEGMLALADTFLKPGSYSTLRSGLFGYMTAGMSQIAAEGVYHRNVLYRENWLNTASLSRSIYNAAKQYEYPIALATPASCRALVGLYLDDIRAALGAQAGTFVLPRGQALYMDDLPFVVAGEVRLTVFDGGQVTAAYDTDAMDFPLPVAGQDYVRTYSVPQPSGSGGATRTAVYMEVALHQAVPSYTEFQVVSASTTENTFFRVAVPVGEQLAGFRVEYRAAGETAFTELETLFNEAAAPTTSQWCYYTFDGDGALEVFFSPTSGDFRPAYNSRLRVHVLTTRGATGNVAYTGVVSTSLPSPLSAYPVLTELVTQPSGGTDRPSLLEIKRGILRKLLLRNNIVIESDLASYLQGVVDTTRVYDSRLSFVKRRDDVQERLFTGFLMAKDESGMVIPSNTAQLELEVHELEDRAWSITPGTVVLYDRARGIYRLLYPGEYPDTMLGDAESFVYAVPYLMAFRTVPFPRLTYYRTHASVDASLVAGPGETATSDSFLASSVSVQRNSVYDDSYTIDLAVNTNLSANDLVSKCLVRARFFDPTTAEDLGYVELLPLQGTAVYRAQVRSSDTFDAKGRLQLVDSLRSEASDALLSLAPIPQNVELRLELYYNNGDATQRDHTVARSGQVFQLVRTFRTAAPAPFYASLDRVMAGRMAVTETGTFRVFDCPLVGASYYLNPRLGSAALDVAGAYQDALEAAFDLLQNSTGVDVKLANTYGPSRELTAGRVNLSLALEVHPTGTATEELRTRIMQACVDFVEACNENPQARFSLSNLSTHLERTIPEISYLRFTALNGTLSQGVQRRRTDAQLEQDNSRVPELLNVAMLPSGTPDLAPFAPDVTVIFI